MRISPILVAIATLASAAGASADGFTLVSPAADVGAQWSKWAYSQPMTKSPLNDTADCAVNQAKSSNAPWFIGGTFTCEAVVRTCKVPAGRTVVYPVINTMYQSFKGEDQSFDDLYSYVESIQTDAADLSVTMDGVPIDANYEVSPVFSVKYPTSDANFWTYYYGDYGLTADFVRTDVSGYGIVDAGYYVAVNLPVGTHTVTFGGSYGGCTQDNTYTLTVK